MPPLRYATGVLILFALLGTARRTPADRPDLNISFEPGVTSVGLRVSSGGDGVNVAETASGVPVRRVSGAESRYLYVRVEHPEYRSGPIDAYVVAQVLDDHEGSVGLQYDRAGPAGELAARYTDAGLTLPLTGSGRWLRVVFHLPDLRLGHGQNQGADFRLVGRGLAVRRVDLSPRPPAGYDSDHPVDAETLAGLSVVREPGMELTFGNDAGPGQAAILKALSVTSVESYVDWAGVEPEPGRWNWERWDRQTATLRRSGLKWVPFLIAGPAYATPLWFQKGPDSRYFQCLEHGKDSRVQSLFNPTLRPRVERFLRAFADRYRDTGVIESVLLGVTGIYGESIYPAGPEGGWTTGLTGPYHNHEGWWAADPDAVASFRASLRAHYRTIESLNKAWGTTHRRFDSVSTFLPNAAPNDRARADLVEWYQAAMTDWAAFWVRSARAVFPHTPIYLCTGGDGNPRLGADFTAQVRAVAPFGAGVRVTNEGSDYAANFSLTREVATATRHYRTFCGFEPASEVNAKGVIGRVYNATASGARQLHDYTPNTLGTGGEALRNLRRSLPDLVPRRPLVRAAVYLSRESWALDPEAVGRQLALVRTLRDVADLDLVTRQSVADGHLAGYQTLVLTEAEALDPGAADWIARWVERGGTLVVATLEGRPLASRLVDLKNWRARLLPDLPPVPNPIRVEDLLRPTLDGPPPDHWSLAVGSAEDESWLHGRWYDRETAPGWADEAPAVMRWSGGVAGVWLPVRPETAHTVRLSLDVPSHGLGPGGVGVRLNGHELGKVSKAGRQEVRFDIPAASLGRRQVARLELFARPWKPSQVEKGSHDERLLGVSLHKVRVDRTGVPDGPTGPATLRNRLDRSALDSLSRKVGSGRTILLPGLAGEAPLLAAVLAETLPYEPDRVIDGRYATTTDSGVLWLDPSAATIRPAR